MYDFEVSPGTISAVTDKLLPVITEWRSRPLEAVYPILFMDGIVLPPYNGSRNSFVKEDEFFSVMKVLDQL